MHGEVKTKLSIKDLESLSGIKAHTIRIWEKRYNLLRPERTTTNIRTYNLSDLQKLLNVTFLITNGYKISKISQHTTADIANIVAGIVAERNTQDQYHAINSLKIAMMNFDQKLFLETYNAQMEEKEFRAVFYETFLPLLHEIGLLWQTDTINPSHEHFIYNLIKQKILLNIEAVQYNNSPRKDQTFVLFLPENEIHELGLIFLNYEIVRLGYKVIYLGQSIQLESLKYLSVNHPNISFVTYFTVKPDNEDIPAYFEEFDQLFGDKGHLLYVMGNKVDYINELEISEAIRPVLSIREFVNSISKATPLYA